MIVLNLITFNATQYLKDAKSFTFYRLQLNILNYQTLKLNVLAFFIYYFIIIIIILFHIIRNIS